MSDLHPRPFPQHLQCHLSRARAWVKPQVTTTASAQTTLTTNTGIIQARTIAQDSLPRRAHLRADSTDTTRRMVARHHSLVDRGSKVPEGSHSPMQTHSRPLLDRRLLVEVSMVRLPGLPLVGSQLPVHPLDGADNHAHFVTRHYLDLKLSLVHSLRRTFIRV